MSFLYIFHDFKDFKDIVFGNISYKFNVSYDMLNDFAKDVFRIYVDEMESISKHKNNPLKFSFGWIDVDNRRIYYFVDGRTYFRNY